MYDPTPELIADLDPGIQGAAVQLVNAAREVGVPLILVSGRRSVTANIDAGGAARSQHLYGLAFDVQVYPYLRDQVPGWWWASLGAYGEALGLRWGGRFRNPDLNHFDAGVAV